VSLEKIYNLKNKIIIITGSSGLLGEKYAHNLSQMGSHVILADTNYSKSKKLEKSLREKYSTNPMAIKLDLTQKSSIKNLVSNIIKKYSTIDVLINNAIYKEGKKERSVKFEDFPLDSWNNILAVNLTGVFLTCQEVGKVMIKQKSGVVINISSIYGLVGADQRIYGKTGLNSSVGYAVTKSGILNLTRYLASYWHDAGIRVNTLSLGGVENRQDSNFIKNYSYKTMLGKMATPDNYVGAMLFLASDASSYMTGSNLIVDGGWTAW
jgi:NAD(P)-dependent dehydrogenase (short-subunit alcohol dehydrogenase family)